MNNNSLVKKGFFASAIVLFGKVLGFVKQSVIAWAFGTSKDIDVYFSADGYTSMFGQIMTQSISPSVLTSYVRSKEKNENNAINLLRSCFVFFPLVGLLICFVSMGFSFFISNLIGIAYGSNEKVLLRSFLIALCPIIFLTSITGVCQGYLEANNRFIPGRLFSLFFSASIIFLVLLFHSKLGVTSLLIGFLLGYVLHSIYMLFIVFRRVSFKLVNPLKNKEFRSLIRKFIPLLIGVSIVDFGHMVDRVVASSMSEGSVSILYYSQVISNDIVNAVIIATIGSILLPGLTKMVVSGVSNEVIRTRISNAMCFIIIFISALTCLYIIEGKDLIVLFFERGHFNSNDSTKVFKTTIFYAFGFLFLTIRELLVKTHYAYGDTISPMVSGIIGVVINIVLSIILGRYLGTSGISLSTSISIFVVMVISFFTIKKSAGTCFISKETIVCLSKTIVSACSAVLLTLLIKRIIGDYNPLFSLPLFGLFFLITYMSFLLVFKEKRIMGFYKNFLKESKYE